MYELLCMARPLAARKELAEVATRAGRTVLQSGGIVADVKSYGEQTLAYTIKTASGERIRQVSPWFLGSTCNAEGFSSPEDGSPSITSTDRSGTTTNVQANFLELKFAASPDVLSAVERDLRLDERIVRWCLRRKPTMPYVPKAKVPKSPRAFEDD